MNRLHHAVSYTHLDVYKRQSEGMDEVIIYCRKEKAVKRLAKGWNVTADEVLLSRLTNYLGESCVKVIEKPIESVH